MAVFQAAELLIPRRELLENWAVIACDQFTSQPDYWRAVREQVMEKPSAYHIVFPEAELRGDRNARIASINETMRRYLDEDVFETYPDAFVFIKRTLQDGSVRRGVVGVIDLEQYDFASDAQSSVRATEQTVVERIPPRVRIRSGAAIETSHVLLLMDDAEGAVLDGLEKSGEELPLLYSFELMQGGGRSTERVGRTLGDTVCGALCTNGQGTASLCCRGREPLPRYGQDLLGGAQGAKTGTRRDASSCSLRDGGTAEYSG